MFTARKYRIYPNKEQEIALMAHINNVRLVYNLALETKNLAYTDRQTNLSRYELQVQLPDLKLEFPYLKETNSQSYQVALKDLDASFSNFFRNVKNGSIIEKKQKYLEKRVKKGLKVSWGKYHSIGKPKFKSKKDSVQSFGVPQNWSILDDKLFIPKIKSGIKVKVSRGAIGKHLEARISLTSTGKWFVSFALETEEKLVRQKTILEKTTIGVDLGIKTFAVLSDGAEFENHKYLKETLNKLKKHQKRLSRKKKDSKNKNKQRKIVAKIHETVSNQRKDFLHKTTSAIVKQYDSVVIEDLNIKGMMQNHKLAQAISDTGWFEFKTMLDYKLKRTGGNLIVINRWFPSSKLHSECGFINKELKLSDRDWTCNNCKKVVNRDLNAAINIKNSGLGKPVVPVENATLVVSVKQESHFL